MNSLATLLLWCVLQVTLVAIATIIAYLLARRRGATLRSSVVLTGLITATLLVPLAWSPWPRWELPRATENRNESTPVIDDINKDAESSAPTHSNISPTNDQAPSIELELITWRTTWNNFVDALESPRSPVSPASPDPNPASPDPNPGVSWPKLALGLFGLALLVGLTRLVGGYWSVRRTIRTARPVRDSRLLELVDVLRAELSCPTPVELRETQKTATAATTGWRRPVILLPIDWRNWTTHQTRAVLAHELAHVARRDYLIGGLAQIALALHFYHPLWQWLVARLRLEQELAADALAASVMGGRETYLKNLAELALRQSDASIAWPARTFLPTRHTFLRRIEMLRDPKHAVDRSAPVLKLMSVVGLLMIGLIVSGIRPGSVAAQISEPDSETAIIQPQREDVPERDNNAESAIPIVAYIPAEASYVITARPQEILNDPAVKPHAAKLKALFDNPTEPNWVLLRDAGVVSDQVEAVAQGFNPRGENVPMAFALRLSKPVDRSVIEKGAKETSTIMGNAVYQLNREIHVAIPEDNVVLIATDAQLISALLSAGQANPADSPWLRIGENLGATGLSVLANSEPIAAGFQDNQADRGLSPVEAALQPAIIDTNFAGVGIRLGDNARVLGYAESENEAAAGRVAETLKAMITLGQNMVRQLAARSDPQSQADQVMTEVVIPVAGQLLESSNIEQQGNTVTLTADPGKLSPVLAVLLPAVEQAREAARRSVSQNNLRQIGIAFHNYHDKHGYFPPAVIEENGVQRSWRVAILPFLDQQDLYDQYRKDEPWDSENNKKVLAQMPDVFRDPSDDSDPNSTSYFVLTNEHAVTNSRPANRGMGMAGNPLGPLRPQVKDDRPQADFITLFTDKPVDIKAGDNSPDIRSITDGTSNTLMVVEASRDIPWTKPEDIPVDPEKIAELIKNDLGGNHEGVFLGALCDGSVRTFSKAIDVGILKGLITPSGGEVLGAF